MSATAIAWLLGSIAAALAAAVGGLTFLAVRQSGRVGDALDGQEETVDAERKARDAKADALAKLAERDATIAELGHKIEHQNAIFARVEKDLTEDLRRYKEQLKAAKERIQNARQGTPEMVKAALGSGGDPDALLDALDELHRSFEETVTPRTYPGGVSGEAPSGRGPARRAPATADA